tara:strand:- start:67 stop:288 length:222 start_codon:yes stop_codon:yes gene_type:complete
MSSIDEKFKKVIAETAAPEKTIGKMPQSAMQPSRKAQFLHKNPTLKTMLSKSVEAQRKNPKDQITLVLKRLLL